MKTNSTEAVKVLIVELFAGMGLLGYGLRKAIPGSVIAYACEWNIHARKIHMVNIFDDEGQPVVEPLIPIPKEEYDALKNNKDTKYTVCIEGGKYMRTQRVQELDGRVLRAYLEKKYGKNILIMLAAGSPCQLMTGLSVNGRHGMKEDATVNDKNSPLLMMESLRVLGQIAEGGSNVCAILEQVPDFAEKQFEELHEKFIEKAKTLPFDFSEQQMFSIHHGGRQGRWRDIVQCTHKAYGVAEPPFPTPDLVHVNRVMDFQPHVEHFFSGHFIDKVKTKYHFMCTVTKGSPKWLEAKGRKWAPTFDELLQYFDVEPGEWVLPTDVPKDQVLQAIANAVCVSVSMALGKNLMNTLRLKPDGNGYWIPIDNPSHVDAAGVETGIIIPAVDADTPVNAGDEVGDNSAKDSKPVAPVAIELLTNTPSVTIASIAKQEQPVIPATERNVIKPGPFYESGFEVYRGKSLLNGDNIVAILIVSSNNRKTGNMGQLYILAADIDPVQAIKTGADAAVCGDCPLRHFNGGCCYVYVGQDARIIWNAWKADAYTKLKPEYFSTLKGLPIRLGSYGDCSALPLDLIQSLVLQAPNYTGYTHQWRKERVQDYKQFCMASVETIQQQQLAQSMGWRTYRIIKRGDSLLPGERMCANSTCGIECKDCTLCRGTSRRAMNITIEVHGVHQNKFNPAGAVTVTAPDRKQLLTSTVLPNTVLNKTTSSKIISSEALIKMNFQPLNFAGRWAEFFGRPSANFMAVIHGLAGHGKSTFAIQFAKHLADNFGRTIYISGEEGFAMTFRDKFLNSNAASKTLDVADLRSYNEVLSEVPAGSYDFMFIDSLTTMKIDMVKLRKLRAIYQSSGLIVIAQATKKGDMRGSYEIVHDSDIAVKVEEGVAETEKNRFKETGLQFAVFEAFAE